MLEDLIVPDDPADVATPIDAIFDKPSTLDEQLVWLSDAGLRAMTAWSRHDLTVIVAEHC